jgi:hypothetical protein
MNKHQLTYIDMYPQPVTRGREWPWAVATVAVFALIGVLLAWRG